MPRRLAAVLQVSPGKKFDLTLVATTLVGLDLFSCSENNPEVIQVPCFVHKTLQGNSFGIIPGGFQEAALAKLGTDRVWINTRKGFIKVRHGSILLGARGLLRLNVVLRLG